MPRSVVNQITPTKNPTDKPLSSKTPLFFRLADVPIEMAGVDSYFKPHFSSIIKVSSSVIRFHLRPLILWLMLRGNTKNFSQK
jgi:hypothetical protein